MLEFTRFDASDCQFPAPVLPLLPSLNWKGVDWSVPAAARALLDGAGVRHFLRGRYALHGAYRLAGVGAGGALLAPSYHCRTMLDPALSLGAEVSLYPLQADLSPDMAALAAALASRPFKAVLLPHYFGQPQAQAVLEETLMLCRRHGAALVEDCAHAWQVALDHAPAAQAAPDRLLIASPGKFFPCEAGGVLWGAPPALARLDGRAAGWRNEARALRRLLEGPAEVALPAVPLSAATSCGVDHIERSAQPSVMYDRAEEAMRSSLATRWLLQRSRLEPVQQRRRAYYGRWLQAARHWSGGRALYPQTPAMPYMFPLLLDRPEIQFYRLKRAGVPVWRWDDMGNSGCAVASDYRLRLLHMPCHQGLEDEQMQWLTERVSEVLA